MIETKGRVPGGHAAGTNQEHATAMTTKARSKRPRTQEPVQFLTDEEGWALLEEQAQHSLGISAREFIELWQAGKIENPDRPEVMDVAALLPLAR
jgi:hypothetical protein